MAALRSFDGNGMLDALDDVIHQKVRLGIMSSLMATGGSDFTFLKQALGVSDGNLATHLSVLEEAGYIEQRKDWVGRKTRTRCSPTESGRAAFAAYVAALEKLVKR
ncbi:MAG: winged helix-turn-helix domain-containing protein [Armatimonadota bacterium]